MPLDQIDLLLSIFFEERNEEGLKAAKMRLDSAAKVQLSVFRGGSKQRLLAGDIAASIAAPFNLLEGVLDARDENGSLGKLYIRYRPAISSRSWAELGAPFDPEVLTEAASRVSSKEEAESFQFFLSLCSFENASRKANNINAAVFEVLHHSVVPAGNDEATILRTFQGSYPEMLKAPIWGFADFLPFRDLSLEEEWDAAAASTLWPDLSVSRDAFHQYMFAAPGSEPKVAVASNGVREGNLTIYRLSPPAWAEGR